MKFIYAICLFSLFISCKDDACCEVLDTECYSFDIRQCQTDEFAEKISESATLEERENLIREFLSEEGYAVIELKLTIGFHEAVCEACDSCPQGDRYFIRVNVQPNNLSLAESLRLLNFEVTDCSF